MAHEQAGLKTVVEDEEGGTLWPLSHTRNLRSGVDAGGVPTKEGPELLRGRSMWGHAAAG